MQNPSILVHTRLDQDCPSKLPSLVKFDLNPVDSALELDLDRSALIMTDTQPLLRPQSTVSSSSTTMENLTDQDHENYVRLCPHQTLPFDTFQRLINLPGTKTGEHIDVFPEPHRTIIRPRFDPKLCFVRNWEIDVDFVATAYLGYKAAKAPEQLGDMVLRVSWACSLGSFPFCKDQKSRQSLRRTLERPKIWLCPHMKLSDEFFVDATYNFLHPVKTTNPTDRYVLSQRGDPKKYCDQCDTLLQMIIEEHWYGPRIRYRTSRRLGMGQSADDPIWVQQCALRRNEGSTS